MTQTPSNCTTSRRCRGRSSKSMHTILWNVPMHSSPSANGTVTDGPIIPARTWLWPLVSAFRSLCSHASSIGRDLFHDASEVGVAAGLELDHRDAACGMRDEHGAHAVAEPALAMAFSACSVTSMVSPLPRVSSVSSSRVLPCMDQPESTR